MKVLARRVMALTLALYMHIHVANRQCHAVQPSWFSMCDRQRRMHQQPIILLSLSSARSVELQIRNYSEQSLYNERPAAVSVAVPLVITFMD